MELIAGLISGLIVALLLWWKSSSSKKRAPGPWGFPIIGYLPFLTPKPYLDFIKIAKRYGNVFSLRLGSQNILILNDFASTKEVFFQDVFIGRPPEFPFASNKENIESGAFFGLAWKEQRRHCLHVLRDMGLGRSKMEGHMQEEIKSLLEYLDENVDIPLCTRPRLMTSMSNNIASLVYGKRFKHGDPVAKMLVDAVSASTNAADQTGWLIFFPWLKKLYDLFGLEPPNHGEREFSKKEIEEHDKTFDPNNIRDFIDGYLAEIKKRKNDPAFCKPVLQDLVSAFFGAGSETVRQSLEWLLLISASHEKAQRRIQAEIQEVIGQSRMPAWPDHTKMPYTDAFIMEMLRWRTLVPINLIRCNLADAEVSGYFVPKQTKILSNTWAIHHDPEYWGPDVAEFNPERFLTEEGKIKQWERFMPFSIGKRACPGKPLAEVEVFLYFTSILQRFNVRIPDGKVADFEGELGVALQPKPQEIVFTKRAEFF